MSRYPLRLTPGARDQAHAWVDKALSLWQPGAPYVLEIREPKRSDAQNAALWGLLGQIQKQRPTHNGVGMTPELWKSVFMQAAGHEIVFVPTLDGDGMFPIGHRSSRLTKGEFADLLTFILAWCAREGLTIEHFDDEAANTNEPHGRAA